MKKTMVLAVSALVLGLILAGCPQPGNDNNGNLVDDNGVVMPVPSVPPISITVEISGHDGNFGSSVLLDAQGNVVASSAPVEITGGSVTMELLNAQTDAPFAATGDFTLMFVISEDEDGEEVVWFGSAEKSLDGGEIAMDLDEDFDGPEESVAGPSDDYRTLPDSALEGSLEDRFNWLRRNAQGGNTYLITVGTDATLAPQALNFFGRNDITVIARGNARPTISLSQRGHLFSMGSGVTLILENVTLQGRGDNGSSLVYVGTGGTLIMNAGTRITGNTSPDGGGVRVSGTFIMYGGEIFGNTATGHAWSQGGGVFIYNDGIFVMRGGKIHDNTSTRRSGGVHIHHTGSFTMYDGEISGNNAISETTWACGGGVLVFGTFTMFGGTVHDNTASGYTWAQGGGVTVESGQTAGGTFNMRGGTISGNAAISNTSSWGHPGGVLAHGWSPVGGIFRIEDGVIYCDNVTEIVRYQRSYSRPLGIYSTGRAMRGTFNEAGGFTSLGYLASTSSTLRVAGGNLVVLPTKPLFDLATDDWFQSLPEGDIDYLDLNASEIPIRGRHTDLAVVSIEGRNALKVPSYYDWMGILIIPGAIDGGLMSDDIIRVEGTAQGDTRIYMYFFDYYAGVWYELGYKDVLAEQPFELEGVLTRFLAEALRGIPYDYVNGIVFRGGEDDVNMIITELSVRRPYQP